LCLKKIATAKPVSQQWQTSQKAKRVSSTVGPIASVATQPIFLRSEGSAYEIRRTCSVAFGNR
jgi:hypothetical protein